jgi:hypothetical protein
MKYIQKSQISHVMNVKGLALFPPSIPAVPADAAQFPGFVSEVNRPLKPLGLELARGTAEDTGEVWYAVVNRAADSAAKIGSCYSPAELELFNKAVSVIHTTCLV